MSEATFDLIPTLLTFTPRLLSSLVLAGLWEWVSSPFIIASLFVLSWLSSKIPQAASAQTAPASPQARGRTGRPVLSDKTPQRSGSASSGSLDCASDSESFMSASTAEHHVAFPGLGRSMDWQTWLGGPGSRRANIVNAGINVLLLAAVWHRVQPMQLLVAQPGCFNVQVAANTTTLTLQTRLSMTPHCMRQVDAHVPVSLHMLAHDSTDTHRLTTLDVARLRSGKTEAVSHANLRHGTAYRVQMVQDTTVLHTQTIRTALENKLLPDGRCSLAIHASGKGLSTRERIHNVFGQTLCGPIGGKSLLWQWDALKAYIGSLFTSRA